MKPAFGVPISFNLFDPLGLVSCENTISMKILIGYSVNAAHFSYDLRLLARQAALRSSSVAKNLWHEIDLLARKRVDDLYICKSQLVDSLSSWPKASGQKASGQIQYLPLGFLLITFSISAQKGHVIVLVSNRDKIWFISVDEKVQSTRKFEGRDALLRKLTCFGDLTRSRAWPCLELMSRRVRCLLAWIKALATIRHHPHL